MFLTGGDLLIHEREVSSRLEERFVSAGVSSSLRAGRHLVVRDRSHRGDDAHTQLRFEKSPTYQVRPIITWVGAILRGRVGEMSVRVEERLLRF